MPFYENFDEFKVRKSGGNNEDYLRTPEGLVVFRNGARSNGVHHADPPTDPIERAKVVRQYLVTKLRGKVQDWQDFKADTVHQLRMAQKYGNLPAPGDEAVLMLDNGARMIERLRAELREVEALIDGGREAAERRQREKEADQRQGALVELDNLVSSINI